MREKSKALEVDVEIDEILSRTPSELSYNLALEKSIAFHKDVEFLLFPFWPGLFIAAGGAVSTRALCGLGCGINQLTKM